MPIEFRCSECNKLLQTSDGTAGRQAKCPECGAILSIPTPDGASQPGPEPPQPPADGTPSDGSPFGTQDTFQPLAGTPGEENPYQSPEAGMTPRAMPQSTANLRPYALARVSTPATILVVFGSLAIPVAILGGVANVMMSDMPGGGFPDPAIENMFRMSPAIAIVSTIISVGIGILMIIGGLKMKKLESYGLCLATSIIAIVPCFSPCCCLEIPFGIWALVVLLDSQVSAAFRQ